MPGSSGYNRWHRIPTRGFAGGFHNTQASAKRTFSAQIFLRTLSSLRFRFWVLYSPPTLSVPRGVDLTATEVATGIALSESASDSYGARFPIPFRHYNFCRFTRASDALRQWPLACLRTYGRLRIL